MVTWKSASWTFCRERKASMIITARGNVCRKIRDQEVNLERRSKDTNLIIRLLIIEHISHPLADLISMLFSDLRLNS